MAASLPASMAAAPIARSAPLPRPAQLAGLGTVLCLYRPQLGAELVGWSRAVRASSQLGVDSDGLRESLWFFDRHDQCCWRLYLLPDSDFVAWDALLSGLPQDPHPPADAGVAERLWRRLARRLGGDSWHARALRLHAAEGELAASVATVSPLGATLARRIARLEAADGEVLVDDCCCARAGQPPPRRDPDHEWPLLRL